METTESFPPDPRASELHRPLGRLGRGRVRLILATAVCAVAGGVGAAVAFARTTTPTIGTGVVVVNTQLAYQNGAAAGTGIVLTSSGEILTNNHVIRGATTVTVVVPGTTHHYTGKVVGYDVTADIAVIKLTGASNLKTAALGDSSKIAAGQAVKAVGNANGTGTLVSSTGTVTALRRTITVSDDNGGTSQLAGLIETNAALQPGDSGGPLLNGSGKVIGMDTAASSSSGFRATAAASDSYAIPINTARAIVRLVDAGKSSTAVHIGATAFLGVSVASTSGFGQSSGAVIAGTVDGGPAATAGLAAGDVITAINGKAIGSPDAISSIVLSKKPGAQIAVTYVDQSGVSNTATVTLGSGPPQ